MFLTSKQDYQNKLFEVINPVLPHYSAGKARLTLGYTGANYSSTIADMESFSRVLWGLAPYFSGGGNNQIFEDVYIQGLTHGSDPSNPEYWGAVDPYDQKICEMAAISVGLLLAPQKLWEPLSAQAKANLAAWLDNANHVAIPPSNWEFFPVLVNVAFKKLGCKEYNETVLNNCLAEINSYYVGNGWYKDGPSGTYDYYTAFALHYYGLIYSVFMEEEDPVNSQNFKDRASIFGKQFVYWFDESGAAVPYGRSMTYRYAQVAFFSACVYAGVEPLSLQVMKGLIDRHLQSWWQSNMQDFSGITTIGYRYPNLIMAEIYNAPGSPLWALKTFLLLALPDDHPYWNAEAADYPQVDAYKMFTEPKMAIVHRLGNTLLFPSGLCNINVAMGHIEEKYGKFAYSSKFGFSVHKANDCLANMAPDNELVFDIGGLIFGRPKADTLQINGNQMVSTWSPCSGIQVTSDLKFYQNGYVIWHTITSNVACTAYICGFSIPTDANNFTTEVTSRSAKITSSYGNCSMTGGQGQIITASSNTNLMFPRTAIPSIKYKSTD
jgi:hypothetical protein